MNRYIIVAIIALVFLSLGGYLYFNSQKGIGSQQTGGHGSTTGGHGAATQGARSYEIDVLSNTSTLQPNKETQFKFIIKNDKGEIFKNYEIAHEKIMHFIAVRKDLQFFQHLHPDYQEGSGEFTVNITFPADGSYRLFPDFTPGTDNPEKSPVTVYHDVNIGDLSKYKPQTVTVDSQAKKTFGEYQATYTLPSDLTKGKEINFSLNIENNGQPVTNLQTYLGALGHSVILKEGTLDFIHTHALEADSTGMEHGSQQMGTGKTGPEIKFATTLPESGNYKIFTQFQHQGKVITTDYVLRVY